MKASARVFYAISAFFLASSVGYTIWSLLTPVNGVLDVEWAGTIALGLIGVFAAFVGFYVDRAHAAQNGELPMDLPDANIDDGDPEQGFFSPSSWWPILMALGCAIGFFGLAVGFWMVYIGAAFTLICIVGWVYEYYRGYFAR
jgi:hypothetical protein